MFAFGYFSLVFLNQEQSFYIFHDIDFLEDQASFLVECPIFWVDLIVSSGCGLAHPSSPCIFYKLGVRVYRLHLIHVGHTFVAGLLQRWCLIHMVPHQ